MSQFDTPFAAVVTSLGTTPESIMTALRNKGVKGYRFSAGRCPIAQYLKASGYPNVSVATQALRFSGPEVNDSDESVYLPDGVRQWILDFDNGKYPEFYLE